MMEVGTLGGDGMMTRRTRWFVWEIGVALVVAAVAGVLITTGRAGDEAAPPSSTSSVHTTTAPRQPSSLTGPALAVKIDNVPEARPQTGLGSAAVVYVEPVEGGLTRLVAVYTGTPPAVVGPVRSGRRTDIELLGQYGRPVLAYSGAAPELLPALHGARLVNASPNEAGRAYYRDGDRPAPHNLYVRPARLPGGAQGPVEAPLRFGPAPVAGTPVATYQIRYRTASFAFTWSGDGWLVSMNGTPVTSTDSGHVRATTVVWQQVQVTTSEPGEDARTVSPVAHTVGGGQAVLLRDGRRFTATWSRPTAQSPTAFRTVDGQDLPLAAGPVWVLLTTA
jgi:DUF3048 family protein